MKLEDIRSLFEKDAVKYSDHCVTRMAQRGITKQDIKDCKRAPQELVVIDFEKY